MGPKRKENSGNVVVVKILLSVRDSFWLTTGCVSRCVKGAKLFYLSGMINGEYQKTEVHNLGRFISVMKYRPLQWRTTHPYILIDRY